ncbi:RNA-directed DNA polymerase from mobile element jockey-like, partial [Brachionus plicatilis]
MKMMMENIDWIRSFKNLSVNEMYEVFLRLYQCACKMYVPKRTAGQNRKKQPPWMNNGIKKLIKENYCLWKKLVGGKRSLRCSILENFRRVRNQIKRKIKSAVSDFEARLAKHAKQPKMIFKYFYEKLNVKPAIHSIKRSDGTITSNRDEIVRIFNEFFHSVFNNNVDEPPNFLHRSEKVCEFNINTDISPLIVLRHLKGLNVSKSTGFDGVNPYFLKMTADAICVPLSLLMK